MTGFQVLSFRIAQDRRHTASTAPLDVQVQLRDAAGEVGSVLVSDVTAIPIHQTRTDDVLLTKSMLKTVRIPLCAFTNDEPNLDLTDIAKVRFVFVGRSSGKAAIDDIEFAP